MSTLLLRLAAPLQAWGIDSKFETRQCGREPSKSGVIGLIAAALGIRRNDDEQLKKLSGLRFGVRVEQEGKLVRDLHTAKSEKASYLTTRYYLADAVFLVGLESQDEAYLNEIADALECPAFPLFLGRRSCPPTLPLLLGIVQQDINDALFTYPWQACKEVQERKKQASLRVKTDAQACDLGAVPHKDVPVSFHPGHRQYRYRLAVERDFVQIHNKEISQSTTFHDAMQELR